MSYMAVTLAVADSLGEHLKLAAFTTMAAVVFIWLGLRQRRTGRGLLAPKETVRVADRLVPPSPPSRGHRAFGCLWIVTGSIFAVPAVINFAAAVRELLG
ncbi:hypothetical protein [Streptomyces sp. NPDC059743]|uniref:hypothetical protein n=1 Tax=Streptomyces sp. NPDC059743 TaxID=3346928 RepID=UPI0036645406